MDSEELKEALQKNAGLIVFLIVIAAAGLYYFTVTNQEKTTSVLVLSGGETVNGALVQVFAKDGSMIAQKRSDAKGVAEFSLNDDEFTIRVSKSGLNDITKDFAFEEKITIEMGGNGNGSTTNKTGLLLKITDVETGKGISGAKISYSQEKGRNNSDYSDENGTLLLKNLIEDKMLGMKITHPSYETLILSILPKGKDMIEAKMKKRTGGTGPNGNDDKPVEFTNLEVTASSEDGRKITKGMVEARDNYGTLLQASEIRNGNAALENLAVGTEILISVEAEGYEKYAQKITVERDGKIAIRMKKGGTGTNANTAGKIIIRAIDENAGDVNSNIQIFSVVDKKAIREEKGTVSLEIDANELKNESGKYDAYYAVADSSERVMNYSNLFSAEPQEITIVLPLKTETNPAKLKVIARDENNTLLPNGDVSIREGNFLIAKKKTGEDGIAEFMLPSGRKYSVTLDYNKRQGMTRVFLDGNSEIQIKLGEYSSFIDAQAFDFYTNQTVKANFVSQQEVNGTSQIMSSCNGKRCLLKANSLSSSKVKISAEGYYEYTTSIFVLLDEEIPLVAYLVPKGMGELPAVRFLGMFSGDAKIDEISAGGEYYAKFLLASENANETGIYLKVGENSDSAEQEIAAITGTKSEFRIISERNSSEYTTGQCSGNGAENAKWAELRFNGNGAQEMQFKVNVKGKAASSQILPLFYRAFTIRTSNLSGTDETFYYRVPEDEKLQLNRNVEGKEECDAETSREEVKIANDTRAQCNEDFCLKVSLEQDGLAGTEGFGARKTTDCDEQACDTCPDSCSSSALRINARIEPLGNYIAGEDYAVKISQKNGNLKFFRYSEDFGTEKKAGGDKTFEKSYNDSAVRYLSLKSLVNDGNDEEITVQVKKPGKEAISETLSMNIYDSCEGNKRRCGDGTCQYFCINNEIPETQGNEKHCPENLYYCFDGICKSSCAAPDFENEFTPNATIEIRDGKVVSDVGEIKLQIDGIFPADSVPLIFKQNVDCAFPLYKVESDTGETGSSACYSLMGDQLVFKSKEMNPACSISTAGDNLPTVSKATLKISCTGATSLGIPLRIIPKELKTVRTAPQKLSGSTAKLFHVINQKQLANRQLTFDGKKNVTFEGGEAKSYAWSGAGKLSITENGMEVSSLNYDAFAAYFERVDDQGTRTDSCQDYLCCAEAWCNDNAAKGAFEAMKAEAKRIASETVFRRGDEKVLKTISNRPFVFSTIMRLQQGAKLPGEIKLLDSETDYGCESDNPRIYAVQAYSFDNKEWKYSARISRLYQYDYVKEQSSCPESAKSPALNVSEATNYQGDGNYLALCDFLTGKKECITPEKQASLAGLEQVVDDKKSLYYIPIPSTFWIAFYGGTACRGLGAGVAGTYATSWTACQTAYASCVAACETATAIETLGISTPACIAACEKALTVCIQAADKAHVATCTGASQPFDMDLPGLLPLPRWTSELCTFAKAASIAKCTVGMVEQKGRISCILASNEAYTLPPLSHTQPVATCVPVCSPQKSFVFSTTCNNQLYAIIHVGITTDCNLDWTGGAINLATSIGQYAYPKYASYIGPLGSIASYLVVGDFTTDAKLMSMSGAGHVLFDILRYDILSAVESAYISRLCAGIGAKG